jgi:hypothetical protein
MPARHDANRRKNIAVRRMVMRRRRDARSCDNASGPAHPPPEHTPPPPIRRPSIQWVTKCPLFSRSTCSISDPGTSFACMNVKSYAGAELRPKMARRESRDRSSHRRAAASYRARGASVAACALSKLTLMLIRLGRGRVGAARRARRRHFAVGGWVHVTGLSRFGRFAPARRDRPRSRLNVI